jgi:hypothetical protein
MALSGVGTTTSGPGVVQIPLGAPSASDESLAVMQEKAAANRGGAKVATAAGNVEEASSQVKTGQKVQKVGNSMAAAAGTITAVGSVIALGANAVPVFGQIAGLAIFTTALLAAACLTVAGLATSFVGGRIKNGGERALKDSLDASTKAMQGSEKAAGAAKAATKKGRRKSATKSVDKAGDDINKVQKDIDELKSKPELTNKDNRKLSRLEAKKTRLGEVKNAHQGTLDKLDASDTAVGTGKAADQNDVPPETLPTTRDGVESAENAETKAKSADDTGSPGVDTSTPSVSEHASVSPPPTA